jgi:hypothetical protein
MEELRSEARRVIDALSDEQLRLVLAYAQCLIDCPPPPPAYQLFDDLLEERV